MVSWPASRANANGVDTDRIRSLGVAVFQGQAVVDSRFVAKPEQAAPFTSLPAGQYRVAVLARQTADASGPVVGAVGIPLTVEGDKTVEVRFSLTTPIDHIEMYPPVMTLDAFATDQFVLTARDASEGVVLADAGALRFATTDPAVATAVSPGVVTAGVVGGSVTIRATDVTIGKSAQATVVVRPPPTVTVLPTTAAVLPQGGLRFESYVFGPSDPTVVWSVKEGASGGTVTPDGVYTAPATRGVYHVVATSVASPRQKATATVTVGSGSIGVGVH